MDQVLLLFLANAAMTATCLAISSMMKSPEQASLVSIYLVGFQLPLSGAVLGLPESVIPIAGIAIGYPGEDKEARTRYRAEYVHFEKW